MAPLTLCQFGWATIKFVSTVNLGNIKESLSQRKFCLSTSVQLQIT